MILKWTGLSALMLINSLGVAYAATTLHPLNDEELAAQSGQALFNLSYLAAGQTGNPMTSGSGVGFYTLSMEAEISLNANIKKLQLGCGGVNGANGCDVDIDNFSLGCVANSTGTCITLPPTGNQKTGIENNNASSNQNQMKDFVLTNPFYQFAIRNPNSASTREVIGVRIGAADVNGPMSFGSLNTFSGYLTGFTNLEMQGQGPRTENSAANQEDVAVTCKAPINCPDAGGRSSFTGMADYRYLGLDNDNACVLFLCADFRDLTISFTGVKRTNLDTSVNGNRKTQAFVKNANLGMGTGGVVKSITDSMEIERSNSYLSAGLINFVKGLIKTQAGNKITEQLAQGLGTTKAALDNNTYEIPYNLSNVHQLNISSNLFGLSLQKESVQYPGYAAPVGRGWAMYIPNAFTLNISDRTTTFVQNIVKPENGTSGPSSAANGNIVGLEAPYRNCYGNLTFC